MAVFDKDNQPLEDQDALARHIATALAVEAPAGLPLELAYRSVRQLFNPVLVGEEHLPTQPVLFVGNHSLFALDGMVLAPIMLRQLGRFPRPLGDKFLFSVPAVAKRIMASGGVMGHPDVCSALMEDGQDLMVFPGGAHESVKPTRDLYQLQWKERYGFVKLAARHGYTLMPFGMVGPDEFYGHRMEGEDLPDSNLGRLLRRLGLLTDDTRSDMLPPIPSGALGTLFPKPQRCYVGFGQPIDLSPHTGQAPDQATLEDIREQVATEIETQLAEMLRLRARSRSQDSRLRRLLTL